MNNIINDGSHTVSSDEAANWVAATPRLVYSLVGESGIGKSTLLGTITRLANERAGDEIYWPIYWDMASKDVSDIGVPALNHENQTIRMYINELFSPPRPGMKPVICMDEFSKAARAVRNMMHPLLERTKPRLGSWYAPEGFIRFLTGNLTAMGVGDDFQAHSINRFTKLVIRKPDADPQIKWLLDNRSDLYEGTPPVCAWLKQTPDAFASWLEPGQENNEMIFNPKHPNRAFVSGRSIEAACEIVHSRVGQSPASLLPVLAGTIGAAAARDLVTWINLQDQLPKLETIQNSPSTARIPDDGAACVVMAFKLVAVLNPDNLAPICTYMSRMPDEQLALFYINGVRCGKQTILAKNSAFRTWLVENQDLI